MKINIQTKTPTPPRAVDPNFPYNGRIYKYSPTNPSYNPSSTLRYILVRTSMPHYYANLIVGTPSEKYTMIGIVQDHQIEAMILKDKWRWDD